nr:ribonuclease H-like domain-containing protein [Tanacetum cinerariifolium]
MERLLYDYSSPRPPKDFHANPNTIIESLPTSPILVEDSDPFMEESDLFLRILHILDTHFLRRLMNDGKLRGFELVKIRRNGIITKIRKNTKNLNTKISKLNEELSDCKTDLYNYKRGLSQFEARLVEFKKHEVKFCERIRGLERDVEIRDNKIEYLKSGFEQIDKDDIEEMDIKGNMTLLCMRADRAPRNQGRGKRESYKQCPKVEEPDAKALMTIDGIGWDWSYMANEEENHALVADDEVLTEFALMAKSSSSSDNKNELEKIKKEKERLDNKLTGFKNASKDSDNLLGSQRSDKNKEGLGYSAVPPPPAQIYSHPKKELSWTGLLMFVDDTVTDYRRPTPSIDASKCNKSELQSSTFSEHGESTCSIMSKPMIKFVKEADCPKVIKINNTENARKPTVKYAEMYRNISKGPKVRGNQRNWNNLKSQQLGKDFLMQNKACFKRGYFDHLASNCGIWVDNGETWPKDNYTHKNMTPKAVLLKPGTTPIVVSRPNINVAQPKMTSFAKTTH